MSYLDPTTTEIRVQQSKAPLEIANIRLWGKKKNDKHLIPSILYDTFSNVRALFHADKTTTRLKIWSMVIYTIRS